MLSCIDICNQFQKQHDKEIALKSSWNVAYVYSFKCLFYVHHRMRKYAITFYPTDPSRTQTMNHSKWDLCCKQKITLESQNAMNNKIIDFFKLSHTITLCKYIKFLCRIWDGLTCIHYQIGAVSIHFQCDVPRSSFITLFYLTHISSELFSVGSAAMFI